MSFKTQVEMSRKAWELGNDEATRSEAMAKLLKENQDLIKPHKVKAMNEGGDPAYLAYARVKIREFEKRVLNRPERPKKETPVKETEGVKKVSVGKSRRQQIIDDVNETKPTLTVVEQVS